MGVIHSVSILVAFTVTNAALQTEKLEFTDTLQPEGF
jgi:hypothetical protein